MSIQSTNDVKALTSDIAATPHATAKVSSSLPIALSTRALCRSFGSHLVVDTVTLAINEGEVYGLLGRNGAGKSTLIKMLTTLLPPSSGTATVGGFDVGRQATKVRRLIGYVPQSLSADGELTGHENLLVFARLYDIPSHERAQRIAEALGFMGLSEVANKLVGTYSGGMIRRLEIAQSMLHRPKLLFLDEPTVGLDPVARETVWEHIRRLRASFDTTIFMTTHYMDEAEALCSRVGFLRAGKLVADGTFAQLRNASGLKEGTVDALFAHYTGKGAETPSAYNETASTRNASQRLG